MFALKLKELRENLGLSQRALAGKLGVSQSTIGMWESGQREPNFKMVEELANFFDVTADYLLGRTDNKKPVTDNSSDIGFDDFTYAMHNESKELTDEDKEMLLDMARMLKKRIDERKSKE